MSEFRNYRVHFFFFVMGRKFVSGKPLRGLILKVAGEEMRITVDKSGRITNVRQQKENINHFLRRLHLDSPYRDTYSSPLNHTNLPMPPDLTSHTSYLNPPTSMPPPYGSELVSSCSSPKNDQVSSSPIIGYTADTSSFYGNDDLFNLWPENYFSTWIPEPDYQFNNDLSY